MSFEATIQQKQPPLTNKEMQDLILITQRTDIAEADKQEAYTKIYNGLSKYIISIMRSNFPTYWQRNFEDMQQEAAMAIYYALKKYQPDKGAVTTWIKPHIIHALSLYISCIQGSTPYYSQVNKKIVDAENDLIKLGIDYTDQDIAERTGLSLKTINACRESIQKTASLDAFEDNIEGQTKLSPEDELIIQEEKEALYKAMSTLSEIQRKILEMRFGITTGNPLPPSKIAEKLNMPKEIVTRNLNSGKQKLSNILNKNEVFADRRTKKEIDTYKMLLSYIPKDIVSEKEEIQVFVDSIECTIAGETEVSKSDIAKIWL